MLVINATQIRKNYSGVGVYSKKIIERIIPKRNGGKIYLQQNEFGNPPGWKIEIVKGIGRDLFRWLWIQLILPRKVNKDDVLFSTFSESPSRCKCKTVIVVHDLMPLKFREKHSKKLNYYYRKILPKSLRNASKIIAISKTVKNEILECFPFIKENRVIVIYNGYDKKLFNPEINTEDANFKNKNGLKDYILYVGRISEIKNTFTLIKAFGEIANKTETDLLIIGRDESGILPKANEYIKQNKLESRVKFIDFLSENELTAAYKSAKIFVLPSFSEGFGLTAVEAMACGIPVIISDIPALNEITNDAAIKFNPENYTELSEKLLLLLQDENLYNNLKQKGLKKAELFDWNKTAELTNNVLLDVMKN